MNIRTATPHDIDFIFNLANDSIVRSTAFTQQQITWDTHSLWFAKQLQLKNPFYIIETEHSPKGYIRFEKNNSNPMQFILTIAIHPDYRGRGIGKTVIPQICKNVFETTHAQEIVARVKNTNIASANLFISCNFIEKTVHPTYRLFYLTRTQV